MKNTKLTPLLLGFFLVPFLLLAGGPSALAQTGTAPGREDQFKRIIDLMDKQLSDKDKLIADKDKFISTLQEQIKDHQELDKNLNDKIAGLQEQIKLLQDNRVQLQALADAKDVIIREQNARISNRDQTIELVRELAKAGKRTTWEKLAEAIPSVAGIIALALAR